MKPCKAAGIHFANGNLHEGSRTGHWGHAECTWLLLTSLSQRTYCSSSSGKASLAAHEIPQREQDLMTVHEQLACGYTAEHGTIAATHDRISFHAEHVHGCCLMKPMQCYAQGKACR